MQAMDKVERVLGIYTKLINGAVVNKTQNMESMSEVFKEILMISEITWNLKQKKKV